MSEQGQLPPDAQPAGREPVFLLPGSVTALIGVLVAIHLASTVVLNQDGLLQMVFWFAFQPLRIVAAGADPALAVPLIWTPFSHALLHGGWEHLLVNVAWFAIFATPVARRYGAGPMLAIFFISAAAGAALFAATTLYSGSYLIGASGGVAGLTGAAVRFIFQPIIVTRHPETGEQVVIGRRLAGLGELWRDNRARFFILIWVVLNAAVPLLPLVTGMQMSVAWQAHLGGFFAGLLMVGLFERRS
ncbi:MAG: rhomboid family intramembrane serine protease [Alphaproteobacteria bacterium]|jgi:membrane associated rhomboid family serine protease|uniref:rhomboid family intramembrane serine protease n=1 Tax=Devosia sp. XGJD_8 TaxID=3391187 RepID=UPI001D66DFB2|nr:rhomboid family intramembrane serine protease [Alphaproteobacteria bacterium]MBU1559501.1 rhomboid family intramembrane serine protease [Alphaproteobacteria bacterium]MBU2301553.1 rhomboid family intramembrane serine protease [Alphaproteobacteria bacterium]MBU2369718.1 rhomboid family intramembrane serine protease [Alphaproteobacteria bacterium]